MRIYPVDYLNGQFFIDNDSPIVEDDYCWRTEAKVIHISDGGRFPDSAKIVAQTDAFFPVPYIDLYQYDSNAASIAVKCANQIGLALSSVDRFLAEQSCYEVIKDNINKQYTRENILNTVRDTVVAILSGKIGIDTNNPYTTADSAYTWADKYEYSLRPKVSWVYADMEYSTGGIYYIKDVPPHAKILYPYKRFITYEKDGRTFIKLKRIYYEINK